MNPKFNHYTPDCINSFHSTYKRVSLKECASCTMLIIRISCVFHLDYSITRPPSSSVHQLGMSGAARAGAASRAILFPLREKQYPLKSVEGLGSGPAGRIQALRRTVTALMRYERLELIYSRAIETRGYTERVCHCHECSPTFLPSLLIFLPSLLPKLHLRVLHVLRIFVCSFDSSQVSTLVRFPSFSSSNLRKLFLHLHKKWIFSNGNGFFKLYFNPIF